MKTVAVVVGDVDWGEVRKSLVAEGGGVIGKVWMECGQIVRVGTSAAWEGDKIEFSSAAS